MKTITWGDLHGRDTWKRMDPDNYDLIIFLGDYIDSFMFKDEEMLANFRKVIKLKKKYPLKVKLLIGNHEVSYLYSCYRATGYRPRIAERMFKLLTTNTGLFQLAFQHGNYLWTHAGIHQGYFDEKIKPQILESDQNLAGTLNRLYLDGYPPIFEVGPQRGGSSKNIGGPVWLDKSLLITNPLAGYHQVVGHTMVPTIQQYHPYSADPDTSVTFCDCQEYGDGSSYELIVK